MIEVELIKKQEMVDKLQYEQNDLPALLKALKAEKNDLIKIEE